MPVPDYSTSTGGRGYFVTASDNLRTDAPSPLRLQVHTTPGGEVEAVVRVRWQLTTAALSELQRSARGRGRFLFLVERDTQDHEQRYLAPVDQDGVWVQFRSPGMHRLVATVVIGSRGRLRDSLLRRQSATTYTQEVLNHQG